jgi:hypothetical protein
VAQQKSINVSAATGDTVIHDVASTAVKTAIHDYSLITSGAGTLVVKDAAGTEFGRYTFAAAGDGIVRPPHRGRVAPVRGRRRPHRQHVRVPLGDRRLHLFNPMSLRDGLLGAYSFDGVVTDSSGGGRHWTHGSPAGYAAGHVAAQALLTDATAGTGSVLYRESAFVESGPLTVEAWAYPEAIQSGQGAMYLWTEAQAPSFFELALYGLKDSGDGTGVWQCQVASGGGQALFYLPGTGITGQWYHLVMTFNGSGTGSGTLKLFVNGVLRASGTKTPNYVVNDIVVNRSTAGGNWFANPATPADACRLGPLRVWNRALTDGGVAVDDPAGGEVAELWADGDGLSDDEFPSAARPGVFKKGLMR